MEEENLYEHQSLELGTLDADDEQIHYLNQSAVESANDYFLDVNEMCSNRGNHSVQVKKGFDGSNYVIDLMVGCPDEGNMVSNQHLIKEPVAFTFDDLFVVFRRKML